MPASFLLPGMLPPATACYRPLLWLHPPAGRLCCHTAIFLLPYTCKHLASHCKPPATRRSPAGL